MQHNDIHPEANRKCPSWAEWIDDRRLAVECKECRCTYTFCRWSIYAGEDHRGGWLGGIPTGPCMVCEARAEEEKRQALPIDAKLVQAVQTHAMANYKKGWHEIVEAWKPEEIWEVIAGVANLEAAIRMMSSVVKLRNDRADDIRSTIW